ncbi:MAG: ABC transporter ATP-binding protein, partial [Bacillota bacterium]|nr:ABC transporter ATP-binding protein [Bacillota bacterium]
VDTREFDPQEFQRMFSVVFQDVNILAASVLENVIGGDADEDARKRGIACLEQAGLKDKIASLPRQYDTPLLKVIEADGVEMSGGQNQKIAIARALYKDANMIRLDEPTAALDALAEAAIYQSFADLVQDKTTVFISHRLSSTRFCDRIALFSPEGLQEYGTHEELMGMKGEYYDMFTTQGKYYQNEVDAHA